MYQGASDNFLGPRDAIPFLEEGSGLDLEAEVAVVTDDVTMGVDAARARDHIKLVMLANDVTLRGRVAAELAKGFGFLQSKPSSAFSPVAVTPEELEPAWNEAKLSLPLLSYVNDVLLGCPNAGVDMTFDFGQLISHAARTRALTAGTIIGSGTVSNRAADGSPGQPVAQGGVGYSCLAEQIVVETLSFGSPRSKFLKAADQIRIEMLDSNGRSIFGAIEQKVMQPAASSL